MTRYLDLLESRRLLSAGVPDFNKIVVVVEENHGDEQIIGNVDAPYINALAQGGAYFTDSHGVAHPSEPNYLAMFSGSTQGVTDDGTYTFDGENLATQLAAAGKTFTGFAEPVVVRKHAPWESFSTSSNVEADFSTFPSDFTQLPDVSFVIPNQDNDMHDGTVAQADTWLSTNLGAYAAWAKANNSLLIVTWDEDDGGADNQIPTIFYGANVVTGNYSRFLDHYQLLATLEASDDLSFLDQANTPVTEVWESAPPVEPPVVDPPTPGAGGWVHYNHGHGGTIKIKGTNDGDTLDIAMDSSDSTKLDVTLNGVLYQFDAAKVKRFDVKLQSGPDTATIADDVVINAKIDGGKGDDNIKGGGGNDHIKGGGGVNTLAGGPGSDRFDMRATDTVSDFTSTEGDVEQLKDESGDDQGEDNGKGKGKDKVKNKNEGAEDVESAEQDESVATRTEAAPTIQALIDLPAPMTIAQTPIESSPPVVTFTPVASVESATLRDPADDLVRRVHG